MDDDDDDYYGVESNLEIFFGQIVSNHIEDVEFILNSSPKFLDSYRYYTDVGYSSRLNDYIKYNVSEHTSSRKYYDAFYLAAITSVKMLKLILKYAVKDGIDVSKITTDTYVTQDRYMIEEPLIATAILNLNIDINRDREMLNLLLPKKYDKYDFTALMAAVLKCDLDILKFLLTKPNEIENINTKATYNDLSAIAFLAEYSNCYEIMQLLIDNGADINIQDNNGYTPLMLACLKNNVETVRILLYKGAKTDIKNKSGDNAVQVSRIHSNKEINTMLNTKIRRDAYLSLISTTPLDTYTIKKIIDMSTTKKDGNYKRKSRSRKSKRKSRSRKSKRKSRSRKYKRSH